MIDNQVLIDGLKPWDWHRHIGFWNHKCDLARGGWGGGGASSAGHLQIGAWLKSNLEKFQISIQRLKNRVHLGYICTHRLGKPCQLFCVHQWSNNTSATICFIDCMCRIRQPLALVSWASLWLKSPFIQFCFVLFFATRDFVPCWPLSWLVFVPSIYSQWFWLSQVG